MSDLQKRVLGSVLSAAVAAGVAYLAPAYQQAALGLFALVMGALHFTKPGDVKPADHVAAIKAAVNVALADIELH